MSAGLFLLGGDVTSKLRWRKSEQRALVEAGEKG